jgi:hypothetical protein
MSLIPNTIAETMQNYPVGIARDDQEHSVDCALKPFTACTAKVVPDRYVAILKDGSPIGTCPNWQRHTQAVREAGTGSELQKLFTWLLGTFQAANPDRKRGDQDPNTVVDFPRR